MSKAAKIAPLSSTALALLVRIHRGVDVTPGVDAEALAHQELRRRGLIAKRERNPELGKMAGWKWVSSPAGAAELVREATRVAALGALA